MRIISGKFKGKRFRAPKNIPTRPTTDFAKEALFNVLRNRLSLDEVSVLDLFAGIGSMSAEFVSREVIHCHSIERHFACVKFMNSLKLELGIDNWSIFKNDVFQFIKKSNAKYDIIFADPPYDLKQLETLPDLIFQNELLNENGTFILEHSKQTDLSEHSQFQETKNYGNVNFTFFS